MPSVPKANILLVDDHPENLLVLETVLEKLGQNLVRANSGEEALRCLLERDFAVILLDVQMPQMDGFETATLIRQRERSRNTPIIFVTALSTNDDFVFKGYTLGAVDYLFKPIDPVVLTSKVSVFVELFQKRAEVEQQSRQLAAINTELRQSEERFRSLSACSPVGIFLLDVSGQCIYSNPRCQSICGFTLEESLGEGWINFLYLDDQERAIADWQKTVNQQQNFSAEYRFQASDGDICWAQVRSSPMFADNGELIGHVGTVEDITARKEAEAMREQIIREQAARQQAETINRMKDEFLAVVSHELRTPLNSILGWSKVLLSQRIDPATTTRALETIERNAKSQAKLIEDILDVSRIVQGKLRLSIQSVNLNELLDAVLNATRPLADAKQIYLQTQLEPGLPRVTGDPERLQQVIWNVLSNAIKFTPNEGRVTVTLSLIHGHRSVVMGDRASLCNNRQLISHSERITYDRQQFIPENFVSDQFVQIAVTDTGIGIHPDFLPHVFDHFRQADSSTTRSHGGLGLGLAIAHHLINLHHGNIAAASDGPGQGATFTITLPVAKTASPVEVPVLDAHPTA